MGERGNIEIHGVWLYTHWGGTELKQTLANALKRGRERWDDAQYLTRIIFCEMIKDDVEGLTGYGITNKIWDNDHNTLHVNCETKQVTEKNPNGKTIAKKSFDKFVKNKR